MSVFVDTDIFIRLITKDDLKTARDCYELFRRARRGAVDLHTSEVIIAEVTLVLTSPIWYGEPLAAVARAMEPLIENRGLHLDHKRSVWPR